MKMVNSYKAFVIAMLSVSALFVGCSDDDDELQNPHDHNEEESITTMELFFSDGTNSVSYIFTDPDGDGGNSPIIDDIVLPSVGTYTMTISVRDESDSNDIENITPEVLAEGHEHQFFFDVKNADVTINYADTDKDGNPIGIQTQWVANSVSTGTVNIQLKHQPDGLKESAPGNQLAGETDIQATFNITVQ